jgi:hypothetical protein
MVINKANPTLSSVGGPYTYDGTVHTVTVNAGAVAGSAANIKYNGGAAPSNAGTYPITADFTPTDTTNYNTLTGASAGSMVINKATPTLTSVGGPYTYDAAVHTVTVNAGAVDGSATNIKYNGGAAPSATGTYPITADFTPTDGANYNSVTGASAGSMVINKAALTVTANNRVKTYGDAINFTGTEFSTNGLYSPDTVTSVTLTSDGAGPAAAAGASYDIIPTNATGNGLINYDIQYDNGQLTVNKADQAIDVTTPAPTQSINTATFDVAATGGASGNPVDISVTGICTGSGENTATITMTEFRGVCVVHYNQAGNSNYNAAPEVTENVPTQLITISGNAGIGGAVLNYTDGGPQTVTADGNGDFTFTVPYAWTGTLTPVKQNYAFSPVSLDFSNLTQDQPGQNFTATVRVLIFIPIITR